MNTSIKDGFIYGLLATLAMTVIMLLSVATKISPMPAPIPVALVKTLLGAMPKPALMALGMIAHFIYGGIAGSIFAWLFSNRTLGVGFLWGAILWLIMQVVFLPILGWGIFGSNITPKIAVATLILHLIYGGTIGWLFARNAGTVSSEGTGASINSERMNL
ncbi:MAG: hypothetical protein K9N46_01350 [Candidatus Marinimicrobia bacterium]|nr:hypothetical protein [Candidatus Neomarinimicrobiota bacterium]MCF7827878.1 hypothetical protein [Candidatus Neomarinimicrobiota bacterium]MCF7879367.1 hypothetical protein [Candidatus Neomarinimicrobiota bacterium]